MPSLCDDVNGVSRYEAQQVGLGDIGRPEPQRRLDEVDVEHESNEQLASSPPKKTLRQLSSDTPFCFCFFCL